MVNCFRGSEVFVHVTMRTVGAFPAEAGGGREGRRRDGRGGGGRAGAVEGGPQNRTQSVLLNRVTVTVMNLHVYFLWFLF